MTIEGDKENKVIDGVTVLSREATLSFKSVLAILRNRSYLGYSFLMLK